MPTIKCPSCSNGIPEGKTLCSCGYNLMDDDCPGCDERIPEGTTLCPHCQYDILEGKPAKKAAAVKVEKVKPAQGKGPGFSPPTTPPEPVVDEAPKPARRPAGSLGRMVSQVVALGNYGQPDVTYTELFWPKDQEPTDENLYEWAERFREAYRTKVPGRQNVYLSNQAIADWCRGWATWEADRANKKGQNDVLRDKAGRILQLLS